MKTLTLLLAVALAGSAAWAQDNPPAAPATAPVKRSVYLAKLPTPAELISDAQAEGMTVSRLEQADDRITVTYQYGDGSKQTYDYKLLSSIADNAPTAPVASTASTMPAIEKVTVIERESPPPRVVYVEEPEVIYYSSPRTVRYYDPYWAPISFGINLGFRSGGGYYRGGYSGGRSGGHHGGGRRH